MAPAQNVGMTPLVMPSVTVVINCLFPAEEQACNGTEKMGASTLQSEKAWYGLKAPEVHREGVRTFGVEQPNAVTSSYSATATASPKWEALEGLLGVVLESAACTERIQTQYRSRFSVVRSNLGDRCDSPSRTWHMAALGERRHNSSSRSSPTLKLFRTI